MQNQSEVARIREQIASEYEAVQHVFDLLGAVEPWQRRPKTPGTLTGWVTSHATSGLKINDLWRFQKMRKVVEYGAFRRLRCL